MARDWNYAKMAQDAKEYGGPEKYIDYIEKHGMQKGMLIMLPVCVCSCILTAKGSAIMNFLKEKLHWVTKKEAKTAKHILVEKMKQEEGIIEEVCHED